MSATDEVVFAWAIGKVLVTVLVAFGVLAYVAWASTRIMRRTSEKQQTEDQKSSLILPRAS
jgi:hypothetical protein